MEGERDLHKILKTMNPKLNTGDYVFCSVKNLKLIDVQDTKNVIMTFIEKEGFTIILKKEIADKLNLKYYLVTSWITLTVHSSLEAIGLTSTFSKALAEKEVGCNVVAAFYHDHIFVPKKDAKKAMNILKGLTKQ
ncbi:MAG: ACT domain-containing protein [Candidatus Pacebacteria bacterium]|nr:ACT domain-containing protein [Candidatus Paceibacterota bacterium]MCF7863042.1 ACT domain-containing protein [Candidatus Paceibacterota bacterium]